MNTDGQRAQSDAHKTMPDEIALASAEFDRMFRSQDYSEPDFLRSYLIDGLARIARFGEHQATTLRDAEELLTLLLALTELLGRLPEELRQGWALGNFVLPPDMDIAPLCGQARGVELTLREASGQLAALLRPITHLACDAPLLRQVETVPRPLHLHRPRTPRNSEARRIHPRLDGTAVL